MKKKMFANRAARETPAPVNVIEIDLHLTKIQPNIEIEDVIRFLERTFDDVNVTRAKAFYNIGHVTE